MNSMGIVKDEMDMLYVNDMRYVSLMSALLNVGRYVQDPLVR